MNHVKKGLTLILITAMACAMLLPGCSGSIGGKHIDLNDYVSVSIDGYNGYGEASVSFDSDKLAEDYNDKLTVDTSGDNWTYEGLTPGDILSDSVSVNISPRSGLSNGDTTALEWDVDEAYIEDALNCTVSYSDTEYTVEDLKETETVDLFEGVEVTFSGMAPDGEASATSTGDLKAGRWSVTPDSGLSNGDTVTVKFLSGDDFAKKYGIVPEYEEKEFTASGLDSCVLDAAQLSDENMATLESEAKDQMNAYILELDENRYKWVTMLNMQWDGSCKETHGDFELQKIYLYEPKDPDAYVWSWDIPANTLVLIYKLPVTIETSAETKSGDVYFEVEFTNLTIEGNGDLVGYTDNGKSVYGSYDELYTALVTAHKDDYNITIYNADRSVAE